ncbi:hypothetical protein J2Z21_003613 [Streptomyces griseochromogenes]|uniref:Uncharacterized protein n=2 Tax=Streptomyces griseochromogenes TaxID=68214 RepID=A0ABS4LTW2_9ACTN|nr:hypothetical protein [Streptomyces griseochromogenes]MBP2050674.1 hypothetical protein [Streptomyces griseochromogenes]
MHRSEWPQRTDTVAQRAASAGEPAQRTPPSERADRPGGPVKSARRLAMEEARRSKRPSRSDRPAGTTPEPDRVLDGAGFEELLRRTLSRARGATDTASQIETLLTLDGRLEADHARRALTRAEAAALETLTRPGREPGPGEPGGPRPTSDAASASVFTSALVLTRHGRLLVTLPGARSLPEDFVGVAARIGWSEADLAHYRLLLADADQRVAHEIHESRTWLERIGAEGRTRAVAALRNAVFMVPPVQLYRDRTVYSNLRDDGNLTGKTLLPTHPDCFFHHLDRLPPQMWTDEEAVVVACLWLLHLSGGPNRIESFNGYQLTLDHVADNFRAMRALYLQVDPDADIDVVPDRPGEYTVEGLETVAARLAVVRAELVSGRRLYYEINATTRRKSEFLLPGPSGPSRQEKGICERLSGLLPGEAADLDAAVALLRSERDWLAEPMPEHPSGFEALIHTVVAAATEHFAADFALSRGIRSLPKLIDALGRRDWAEIVSWELPDFYCCVVPGATALAQHGGDRASVADSAWAMSARMQYNTWHVMPGNLPKDPAVQARDFLAPHALPDLAVHSDLHHRGHVANNIRYSARSPERVMVAGHPFQSLTDLRILRCEGPPFERSDLVAVTRVARFLAQAADLVAESAQHGKPITVTAFDHHWHRRTIIDSTQERHV